MQEDLDVLIHPLPPLMNKVLQLLDGCLIIGRIAFIGVKRRVFQKSIAPHFKIPLDGGAQEGHRVVDILKQIVLAEIGLPQLAVQSLGDGG